MTNADQFLNQPKKKAQDMAEAKNMIFRLIRIDEKPFFDYPEDQREDRVCVEIDKGMVTKATIQ